MSGPNQSAEETVLGLLLVAFLVTGCAQQPPAAPPSAAGGILSSLPNSLAALQEATGYLGWEQVQGYSRALTHHRQLRFHEASNVFVAETGARPGLVDVVEVILMPLDAGSKVELALYDPASGERITHYPDSIRFDIFGWHGGSRDAAPGVCVACHEERKPLIAVVPWNPTLEADLKRSRATGQGIRQDLLVPVPDDEATRARITALNKIMEDKSGGQINDIREWMAVRTPPRAEPDGR
jgi:hypothetical protein